MPPRRECGRYLKRTSRKRNTANYKERKTKNRGEITGNRSTKHPPGSRNSLWQEYTVARFSLLVCLAPSYPACRLRPAFVNNAPLLGVRQHETSKAGSSSTYARRLFLVQLVNEMKITDNQAQKRRKKKKKTKEDRIRSGYTSWRL